MKYLLLPLAILLTTNWTLAQSIKSRLYTAKTSVKIDSVFSSNFSSIEKKLRNKQPLTLDESRFIYVAGFMSGIGFDVESYAGTPILKLAKLTEFEKWYSKNQDKIAWDNFAKGLKIISSPPTDTLEAEIATLRII